MARGELTPQELQTRKDISQRLNSLLSSQGKTKSAVHEGTKIPKSTLTGYFAGTSTPTAGNIQKLADYFGVPKSSIDPRFETATPETKTYEAIQRGARQLSKADQKKLLKLMELTFDGFESGVTKDDKADF